MCDVPNALASFLYRMQEVCGNHQMTTSQNNIKIYTYSDSNLVILKLPHNVLPPETVLHQKMMLIYP